jgi:putative ABC transport system ATP-binding protein
MSTLTPELVAKILLRQRRITPDHAELIQKEARAVPRRVRSHRAYEQKAVGYELVTGLNLPDQASPGDTIDELAIARAIAADPPVLLADEPTAHLDHDQVDTVRELFRDLTDQGRIVLVSTHDDRLEGAADRIVRL